MDEKQSDESSQLAEELKSILTRSIEGNLQLLTRVSEMVREAAGAMNSGTLRTPQQPADLLKGLVRLNLSYLSALSRHGLAFAEELTTTTERALGLQTAGTVRTPPPSQGQGQTKPQNGSRVEINLNTRVGETANAAFLVENPRSETMKVSFEASEVLASDGTKVPSAQVRLEPQRLELKSGAQETVRAMLHISPEFKPGLQYVFRIRVAGLEQKEIWVVLNVLPGNSSQAPGVALSAAPKAGPAPQKKSGSKKRKK